MFERTAVPIGTPALKRVAIMDGLSEAKPNVPQESRKVVGWVERSETQHCPDFTDFTEKIMFIDKKGSKLLKPAFLLLVAVLTVSCGTLSNSQDKKKEGLRASVEGFNSSFRWEDYQSASAFVTPAQKELFWAEVDKFKGKIRLVDFQIRDIAWTEKAPTATAIVYFQYYRMDSPTLETISFPQRWYYSEKENIWRLDQSGYQAITKEGRGL